MRAPIAGPATKKKHATLIQRAKRLAFEYRRVTGRPLGVAGEVAEFEAARLLDLNPAPPRQHGFDLSRKRNGRNRRYQVKCRVRLPGAKPGQRLGSLKFEHPWDAVLLVVLDERLQPVSIFEATRAAALKALKVPGSRARNERGQLGVRKFQRIARCVWPVPRSPKSAP